MEKFSDSVLANNHQYIVVDKPQGIPAQKDLTGDKSLIEIAGAYCKSQLYPINRIDRPAKGVVVFAKSANAAAALNEQLKSGEFKKSYLAIVKGTPDPSEAMLTHFLKKNKQNKSIIVEAGEKGAEKAELKYKVLGESDHYTLLEIDLLTGRHHQIRAQLSHIGFPIKGDVKYGARRGNQDRSIHLIAWKLSFRHPVTSEQVNFEAALPDDPVWNACKSMIDVVNPE